MHYNSPHTMESPKHSVSSLNQSPSKSLEICIKEISADQGIVEVSSHTLEDGRESHMLVDPVILSTTKIVTSKVQSPDSRLSSEPIERPATIDLKQDPLASLNNELS